MFFYGQGNINDNEINNDKTKPTEDPFDLNSHTIMH